MKKKLSLLMVALVAIAAFAVQKSWRAAEQSYTITFCDTGTDGDSSTKITAIGDIIASGADYVSEISTATNVYKGRAGRGLKLGTSSSVGQLTLGLKEAVKPTKIVVKARKYNDKGENYININDNEFTLTDNNGEDCEIKYDGNTDVSQITIKTTSTDGKYRTYVISLTVYCGDEASGGDPVVIDKWTIAGNFNGWSVTDESYDMTSTDNVNFTLVKDNLALFANETNEYKVAKDHSWTTNYGANGVQDGGNVSLPISEDGIYKVTFTFVNDDTHSLSAEAEKTGSVVSNIAALNALESGTKFAFFGNALVVAKPTPKYVYIKDDTGSSLIYDASGEKTANVEVGKTLAANWSGSVSIYKGLFEAVPNAVLTVNDGDAVEVQYPEATAADLTAENVNKVVEIKGLTISASDKNITFKSGETEIVGYNQFGIELPEYEGKTFDVVGVISIYNDNVQFQPITPTEVVPLEINSMEIVGKFPGMSWTPGEGLTMNQDATNPAIWTATMTGVDIQATTYEFKATANGQWGVYELPAQGNASFLFSSEAGYPAGKYDLVFTVNTSEHTLVLTPQKEDDPEKTAPDGWTKATTNGSLAGDDVSNFVSKEYPSSDVVPATIIKGAGMSGSRGILVQAGDNSAAAEPKAWDSQFWIVLSEELPTGSMMHVEFDYKANKNAKVETQAHGNPGDYHHWSCIGDVNFTDNWQHFSTDVEIDDAMAKGADGTGTGLKSIAFNLAADNAEGDFYFDNIYVWYQKPAAISDWTDLVANGTMEGDDNSCFYVTEPSVGGPYLAPFIDDIGKDGSRAVKVVSAERTNTGEKDQYGKDIWTGNDWDAQFFIRLPYQLPAGTKYRVSFDYKADKAGAFDTQSHAEPGQYIHWTCVGSGNFTTSWQTYEKEGTIPAECDGSQGDGFQKIFQTIAFNLSLNHEVTEFVFDNVKFEVPTAVVSSLNENPAVNLGTYPVINSMAIRGTFPGMSWDVDGAIKMTQDATNAAIWTATLTNVEVEGTKYEYKAFANNVTNGYQLPADHNQEFEFGTDGYPAGTYDLTFTANTEEHTVTLDAVNKGSVNIEISPESGADIAAALATATEGKVVGNITINLAQGGAYTIGSTITAPANVTINGNSATIDASALTAPFIQMATIPEDAVVNEKGAFVIDGIIIKDVTITGLPYQLVYGNKQKYLMTQLLVDNCVIGINGTAKKTIFDFNGGGNAGEIVINKSTLWANPSNSANGGLHSSQSGHGSIQDLGSDKQLFAITNSTIYNITKGSTVNTQRRNNSAGMEFKVENSVIVNSGKSGQFVVGLNGGAANSAQTYTISGNAFNFEDADVSEAEQTKVQEKIAGQELNSVAGVMTFTDAANGDFNGSFALAEGASKPEALGDPRWTITFPEATPTLTELYIIGIGTESGWDATTAMTLNDATKSFEYKLNLTATGYFAFSDKEYQTVEWDDLNANHRYAIAQGDNTAELNTEYTLQKVEGTIVLGAGEYTVSVTQDLKMTITGTATQPVADGYYVVGNMNGWAAADGYKLELNEEAAPIVEYTITIDLEDDAQFKIGKAENGVITVYYPDGQGNAYGENGELATGKGSYTIYFRPDGNGEEDWFNSLFYVQYKGEATAISGLNLGKYAEGEWYTIQGVRIDRPTQKGLYIRNGRTVIVK